MVYTNSDDIITETIQFFIMLARRNYVLSIVFGKRKNIKVVYVKHDGLKDTIIF